MNVRHTSSRKPYGRKVPSVERDLPHGVPTTQFSWVTQFTTNLHEINTIYTAATNVDCDYDVPSKMCCTELSTQFVTMVTWAQKWM
jgi:hypothetical protein